MKITTTARHYELTPALKDYAEKKILNLDKYSEQIDTAHATFSLEKYRHVVEIAVHLNGKEFNGTEESEDMYASIDKAVDKIERQLLKHKGKIKKRKSNKKIAEMDYEFPDAAAPAAGASEV
jgi:putative sigma-54 modulation protein